VIDLFLTAFVFALFAAGLRKPFVWVLAYVYIDVLAPQKISWFLLQTIPISLIAFTLAFLGWAYADAKQGSRFGLRQWLIVILLGYCGATTLAADIPEAALAKWDWVWKALVFAAFLPLALRTRLRIEATALVMVLAAGAIVIPAGIKTLLSGGGYGALHLLVNDNVGLYEGSILSTVAIAVIPLGLWLARHGTIFTPDRRARLFALALAFACALIPVGTEARTGLVCLGVLALLGLRQVKRRFLYVGLIGAAALLAAPFLPQSFTARMETISDHQADQSASTRLAVWRWTIDFVRDNPLGGGFDAYRQNRLAVEIVDTAEAGNTTAHETRTVVEKGRAYHSSYFEMLGEQGWPGLALWLLIHLLGVWQMERVYRRYRRKAEPDKAWIAPLAYALLQAQIVYLVGSLFVGVAYQPFCYMIVALQCGLWSWVRRRESAAARGATPRPLFRRRGDATASAGPAESVA
jgi:probable O-glycosylation ligase (exosortase A-associated)